MDALPLAVIIRNVAEKLSVKAVKRNVIFHVHVPEDIKIWGNGDKMVQLIMILGDNALKYSPENGIVSLDANKLEDGSVLVLLRTKVRVFPQKIFLSFGNASIRWKSPIAVTFPVQVWDWQLPKRLSVYTAPVPK